MASGPGDVRLANSLWNSVQGDVSLSLFFVVSGLDDVSLSLFVVVSDPSDVSLSSLLVVLGLGDVSLSPFRGLRFIDGSLSWFCVFFGPGGFGLSLLAVVPG